MNENVQIVFGLLGGLAIFLFGMNMMSESLQKAAGEKMKAVLAVLTKNPVLGVLSGALVTAVLQNFATQAVAGTTTSIIGLAGAIPILLGDNIGTTITAILASLNQSIDAKRTALAHCIFNISGTLLFVWFVGPYAKFIQWLSPKGPEVDVISRQIANAHTGFNIAMTLIWTPLLPLMVKIVMKLLPDRRKQTAETLAQPKYLDRMLIGQPLPSLHLVSREVLHVGHMVRDILIQAESFSIKGIPEMLHSIQKESDAVRSVGKSIDDYTSSMFGDGSLTGEQASQLTGTILIKNDMVRISDLCEEIVKNISENDGQKKKYSRDAIKDLRDSFQKISELYGLILNSLIQGDTDEENADSIRKLKPEILSLDDRLRRRHMKRISKNKCSAELTGSFNDLLYDLARIGTCCITLSEFSSNNTDFHTLLEGEPEPGTARLSPVPELSRQSSV